MTKKLLASALITGCLVVGAPGMAQAGKPVPELQEQTYCGPGQSVKIYDWRKDRIVERCTDKVQVPHRIQVKRPPVWWNPWTWY